MLQLRAGHLQVGYENGFLRHITSGGKEIVRMLYFALRDENWATLQHVIAEDARTVGPDSFRIAYHSVNRKDGRDVFRWQAALEGKADGTITFEIHGEALEAQLKNRAGFCALHPIRDTAGQPVTVHHVDGTLTTGQFPVLIDPVNPFKDIKSLLWTTGNETYSLSFDGDTFETEDQRNWSDASFKTFCTPSAKPFPVALKKGDHVFQKITFQAPSQVATAPVDDTIRIITNSQTHSLPPLGIGAALGDTPLPLAVADQLRSLGLSHYRVEVTPLAVDWVTAFSRQCVIASQMDLPLEVVLTLSADFKIELDAFVQLCLQNRLQVKSILAVGTGSPATPQPLADYLVTLKDQMPKTKFGIGTNYAFHQINQNRLQAPGVDFISFGLHPQEHAFDNLSIVENLEAQRDVVASAQAIYPQTAVHLSPITLRKRLNPYAADPHNLVMSEQDRTDPRQLTPFCAVWTLGSIKTTTQAGAASLTYYQTHDGQGIVSAQGAPYPVYGALQNVLKHRSKKIRSSHCSHPLVADALWFDDGACLVWNYTDEEQAVFIGNNTEPLTLPPYAIVETNA